MVPTSKSVDGGRPPGAGKPVGARIALVERIAGWSVRHRGVAIGGWLALVAVAFLAGMVVEGPDARTSDPGDTGRAQAVLNEQEGFDPIRESVLVQAREPGGAAFADDPELRRAADDLVAALNGTGGAAIGVRSPTAPDGADLISADGRSALVTFEVAGPAERVRANFKAAVDAVDATAQRYPDLRVAQAGDRSLTTAVDQIVKDDLNRSHLLSLPIVLIILVLVFGSLVAASIPVLLTLTGVLATFSLLQVIGKVIPINSAVSSLILLIGIAVGVDYSLFYLRRYREERLAGRDGDAALRVTARTSGHVVVVSGLTVMLCLTGLLFTELDAFRGLTVGTVLVVGLAMIASVTVLPAAVALLGDRVDKLRVPLLGRGRVTASESRIWSAIVRRVVRRPALWGGGAALALVVMALPVLNIHLQDAAVVNSLPRSVVAVDNAVRMQEAFPGAPTPTRVVVWREDGSAASTPEIMAAVDELRDRTAADGAIHDPIAVAQVDRALVLRVPISGSGTDETTNRALEELRTQLLPETLGRVDGVDYAVSGKSAQIYDFTQRISERTPLVFGFVLLLAFVLLVVAFRSLAIPLVSIVLNLLAIGAACGVVTWIFQYGNLEPVFGFTSYGGVMDWLPLFIFVILFGLSMDYHIFILSRVRERLATTGNARAAISAGIESSAGVVTSAAVIMTAVFAVFIALTAIENKQLGIGMAVAVILDATVVRGVLLPAAMSLLGERAWTLPGWLRWFPGGERHRTSPVSGPSREPAQV
ncbi:MMPL family transporter [Saccharothrix xinjiangensis]|uniref:MMPL family transporter n=1 Tax=Saccharothrix xinjiangensis TaxID=204798 RepID=A0ABV9YEE0_9PSEU